VSFKWKVIVGMWATAGVAFLVRRYVLEPMRLPTAVEFGADSYVTATVGGRPYQGAGDALHVVSESDHEGMLQLFPGEPLMATILSWERGDLARYAVSEGDPDVFMAYFDGPANMYVAVSATLTVDGWTPLGPGRPGDPTVGYITGTVGGTFARQFSDEAVTVEGGHFGALVQEVASEPSS
jgi:hypothetical protein